jgi:hypothetical protein
LLLLLLLLLIILELADDVFVVDIMRDDEVDVDDADD